MRKRCSRTTMASTRRPPR